MKVSVILPSRNEEQLLKNAILDVFKYIKNKKYSFEILVVENGSDDNTEEIIRNLQKAHKEIKLLKSKPGYGYALRKGIENAAGEFIIIFNVDFYDLRLIDLIDIDLYGRDFIIGSKMANWSKDKRSKTRKFVSYLFNKYLNIALGFKGSDTHGIKIIKREVIKNVYKKCKTTSGIFDTELVIRAQRAGYKFADFPVTVEEKRPPRFTQRLIDTPKDIYNLTRSLSS